MGQGPGLSPYTRGEVAGSENVTLLTNQMPVHNHGVQAAAQPNAVRPLGAVLAPVLSADPTTYSTEPAAVPMHPGMITSTGGGQPHPNLQPLLVLNYCIALEGLFPSRD